MSAKPVRGLPGAGHRDGLRLTTASSAVAAVQFTPFPAPNGGSTLTLDGRSFGIEGP